MLLVLVACLLAAPLAPTASAGHYDGHECLVEVEQPLGRPFCFPTGQTIYDGINKLVCSWTGECTPLLEIPTKIVCEHWPPPNICQL